MSIAIAKLVNLANITQLISGQSKWKSHGDDQLGVCGVLSSVGRNMNKKNKKNPKSKNAAVFFRPRNLRGGHITLYTSRKPYLQRSFINILITFSHTSFQVNATHSAQNTLTF